MGIDGIKVDSILIQHIMCRRGGQGVRAEAGLLIVKVEYSRLSSEPATFVQRLPNVFQTPWQFGTRWVVVVQTSLVHWV